MYATCFSVYFGQPQACQHKNHTKEDITESKGPHLTVNHTLGGGDELNTSVGQ